MTENSLTAVPSRDTGTMGNLGNERVPAEVVVAAKATVTDMPLLVIRPRSGFEAIDFAEIWRYRDLLVALAVRDVKLRYRQTALGVIWVLLQPLLASVIFYVVGRKIANIDSEGTPYFLFIYSGFLVWNVFNSTLTKVGTSLIGNTHLVTKTYFPRLVLPMSTGASTLIDFGVGFAFLLFLLPFFHQGLHIGILLMPVFVLLVLLMSVGIGLIVAALTVTYRDVQYILPVFMQFMVFAQPLLFPISKVKGAWEIPYSNLQIAWQVPYFLLNPLGTLIALFRWSILGTTVPPAIYVVYSVVATIGVFLVGALYFRKMEKRFADVI